ncbi:efflux RND transporter periplasmic adaptor subunit [Paraflavitalea sp. CAU 1676]|uniref:efflux RND transporter periplasmic adaptor subunit n=1 Tax=Paraflavitalea sp. CAU 1676 TaxID=3032598 RepID=UPI0023DAACA2|nr:efflux RND transporter periplasmic adaptor subunit [Paraflavitalea sp. CAU 1676]MDF2189912.1 efflux RND transporter periplasmic adaptor subunit [Paraflavitalea sp. CAU 1676]
MKPLLFPVYIVLMWLPLASCQEQASNTIEPERFCLSDTLQKNIELATVQADTVRNEIALSGKIEANEDKWIKVFPVVGGIVESLKVQLGDYVTKGQVLAVVRSSEIADYQGQLSNAASTVKLAEKSLTANKEMFAAGLATEKDVLAAETDLDKARADLKRIRETNAIYGASGNALQTITAPVSGFIVEKNVTDKMQYRVEGSDPFFIISNLDEVWVIANVFESDISKIQVGYDAQVSVIAYKDKVFKGKVDRIYSILDPQSRVMKVRIRIPNDGYLLKPEMFAQINIEYTEGREQMPAIPAQAMIFDHNRNFVMVHKDHCQIETREVEPYKTIGTTTYIRSGLQEGEKVIARYQLLIYGALNN